MPFFLKIVLDSILVCFCKRKIPRFVLEELHETREKEGNVEFLRTDVLLGPRYSFKGCTLERSDLLELR